jgi:hypothetical protein
VLWLQTMGERCRDEELGRGDGPPAGTCRWTAEPSSPPPRRADVRYDAETLRLHVGDGVVDGVRPEVWDFTVSGWPVVPRWLEHRTAQGRGRRSSDLDAIRPDRWSKEWSDELLWLLRALQRAIDLRAQQDELLSRIVHGPLVGAGELPEPTAAERAVPPTIRRRLAHAREL